MRVFALLFRVLPAAARVHRRLFLFSHDVLCACVTNVRACAVRQTAKTSCVLRANPASCPVATLARPVLTGTAPPAAIRGHGMQCPLSVVWMWRRRSGHHRSTGTVGTAPNRHRRARGRRRTTRCLQACAWQARRLLSPRHRNVWSRPPPACGPTSSRQARVSKRRIRPAALNQPRLPRPRRPFLNPSLRQDLEILLLIAMVHRCSCRVSFRPTQRWITAISTSACQTSPLRARQPSWTSPPGNA